MKTLILTNIPSPYRVAFFNELGKSCSLTVAFEGNSATDRNKNWQAENAKYFTPIALNGLRLGTDKFLSFKIINLLQKIWDAIIICGYSTPTAMLAIEYLRFKNIPFYLEVDGGIIRPDSKLKFWFKKHLISAPSGWFSSGKTTTKYLVHYGATPEKIYQYPFTSLMQKDILPQIPILEHKKELRKALGITENKVLISVGQFIHRKGYDILLKAAANLPKDIGIYIIGDNPTEEYLSLQKELSLPQVHFVGFQSKEELKKWYQAADVFVLPTREDIWGLVINEAMAQGLPIITTDKCIAGLELVKNEENGYIIPTNAISALEKAIKKIFTQDYYKMGQKSLELINNYTIENMVERHIQILHKEPL